MGAGVVCTTWAPGVCPPGVGGWVWGWGVGGGGVKNCKFSKSENLFKLHKFTLDLLLSTCLTHSPPLG